MSPESKSAAQELERYRREVCSRECVPDCHSYCCLAMSGAVAALSAQAAPRQVPQSLLDAIEAMIDVYESSDHADIVNEFGAHNVEDECSICNLNREIVALSRELSGRAPAETHSAPPEREVAPQTEEPRCLCNKITCPRCYPVAASHPSAGRQSCSETRPPAAAEIQPSAPQVEPSKSEKEVLTRIVESATFLHAVEHLRKYVAVAAPPPLNIEETAVAIAWRLYQDEFLKFAKDSAEMALAERAIAAILRKGLGEK